MALAPTVLLDSAQLDLAPQGLSLRSRAFLPDQLEDEDVELKPLDASGPTDAETEQALLGVFYANLYIGKIWHSGGYELLPEVGNQVRSLGLTFSLGREYAEQAQQWSDATFAELLGQREGLSLSTLDSSVAAALTAPTVRKVRGSGPLDGEDNQNLPRFTLEPAPLDPSKLPQVDAPAVLVPIVVHYFAHNGGWFVGQGQGTPAGARFRLLWVLHDSTTGQVLTWGDVSARYVEPYFYSPNDVQLQDYLLQVEARVRAALEEELLPG